MKKFWKATLFPGLFCILAGLIVAAILVFGYSDELREHADEFSINEENFYELFVNIGAIREGMKPQVADTNVTYHFAAEKSENIIGVDFSIAVGEVEIRTGDTMEVVVTDMLEGAISSYVEDGIWYITDSLLGSVQTEYCPDIIITVPKDSSFEHMMIYLAAGMMNADKLAAREMHLEVDAGSLKIHHLAAEEFLTVKNGAGEIIIYDATASNLTVEQGIGAIDITGDITGFSTIKGGIGEIELSLTNRPEINFNYKVSGGLGEVEIGDRSIRGNSENFSFDSDTADYFEIDCGIGRIEIDVDGN